MFFDKITEIILHFVVFFTMFYFLCYTLENTYNFGVGYFMCRQVMFKRIRDLREDRDLTQTEMAQILNCSQQVYSNSELGQRDIPTQVLIALADFYDTTTDYILGRSSERHPPRKRE